MADPNHPDASPDSLTKALSGLAGRGAGVRRLNRWPLIIVFAVASVFLVGIAYTFYVKSHPSAATVAANAPPARASAAVMPQTLQNGPASGEIAGASNAAPALQSADQLQPAQNLPAIARTPQQQAQWDRYTQAQAAAQERTSQAASTALLAPSSVTLPAAAAATRPSGGAALEPAATAIPAAGTTDPNGQDQKRAFLASQGDPDYLNHDKQAPRTVYDVKAGTVIPATMISGLNSDLPGQIIAQVRENVYDSATGRYLIIPQGSRLIGTYDSSVTLGQSRALTVWRRVIFPDSSSLDLNAMPGADQSGYAGFNDLVDNHYWRLIGDALLVAVFSAGIQLSQPQATNGENITNQQVVAAALGQELGQVGMEVARRDLNIQPTLEIRPGYLFNVMVTRDMVMPPFQDGRKLGHTGP